MFRCLLTIFIAVLANSMLPSDTSAAIWSQPDTQTLQLEGKITDGDLEKLQDLWTTDVTTLVLNSSGGSAHVGLRMGMFLKDNALQSVLVTGLCISACANYLFVAAKNKIIQGGIVGFHGNIASYNQLSRAKEFEAARSSPESYGITAEHVEVKIHRILEKIKTDLPLETAFFEALGISQALFVETQNLYHSSGIIHFYLPNANGFENYGILNVTGKQNLSLLQDLNSRRNALYGNSVSDSVFVSSNEF